MSKRVHPLYLSLTLQPDRHRCEAPIFGTVAGGPPDGRCDTGPARDFLIGVVGSPDVGHSLRVATTPDEHVPTPKEQLIAGYVANTPDGAYYNVLMDALRKATPEAVRLLVEIAEQIGRVDDEQSLCDFGAGPLETFLTHSGPDFVRPVLDELTSAARSSDKFRQALECVWWTSDLDPQVVAWLRRFCPPPIDG